MGKVLQIFCDTPKTSVYNVKELNSSFATASIDVMYTGGNRNGSDFSRESVLAALPTMYNVPIVCNYDPESREIGGHDYEVVADENGKISLRNLTVPCGVVTEHTQFSFQNKKDEDGVEHEYLVADNVILWKRQDVYDYIVNECEGNVPHSMEINVLDGAKNEETGLYSVKSFEFTALCLLGTATPCFEGSKLSTYSYSDMKSEMAEMMSELQKCYSMIASADAVDNTTTTTEEGGDKMSDEIKQIVEEFGYDVNNLEFSIEGMTAEEVRAKFEAMKAEADTTTDEGASTDAGTDAGENTSDDQANFELTRNLRDWLGSAVAAEKATYEWGEEYERYWLKDFDEAKSEVYVEDKVEGWRLYAFSYKLDNDTVVIDWESKKRMKFAIVEFNEGDTESESGAANMFSALSDAVCNATAERDAKAAELEEMTAKFTAAEEELATLRQFKADVEAKEISEKIADVFSRFTDLSGNEMFEALRSETESGSMTIDPSALEEKCFAIRGRIGTQANFSLDQKSVKINLEREDASNSNDTPYGGIVEKYSNMYE